MKKRKLRKEIKFAIVGILIGMMITAPISAMLHDCEIDHQCEHEIENIDQESNDELTNDLTIEIDQPIIQKTHLGEFKITAYCACEKCCGKYASGYTSIGAKATQGRTIAVDPNVIPYGSIVEINGHEYVAEDCGGAIKQNRIDIYFDSHQDALNYGVQYHDVYLIESEVI